MTNLDKIFKAYDIRGVYPDEINEEIAYKVGMATAKFLKAKELVVGRDSRLSSENLAKTLIEGIRDQGTNVVDIGLATTPMFYFHVAKHNYKGGIMITASHNPPKYNGFKIVSSGAMPIGDNSGLKKIKKLVKKINCKNKNRGELKTKKALEDYIEHIIDFIHPNYIKRLKIVADSANGTAGLIIPEIFKKIPVDLVHIFSELDGSFPNHGPNPLIPENTKALQQKVLSEKADLGIAFDGDGDRIVFIDEKGERVAPDLIATLLIHYIFKDAGKILHSSIVSQAVREEIKNNKNIPIICRVGYTFIKEKMKREKIVFGAESSGHYYLEDNYFNESPFIIFLKILEIISKTKIPLSELVKPFKKYYLERMNFQIKNPKKIIKAVKNKFKKSAKISHLDGLTIEFKDWWFNLRPSNTEPILRLTIEAKSKELLEQKKKELLKLIPSSA